MKEFDDWSEHMGFEFLFTPENTKCFGELYAVHDPALLIHTNCLMPFERCYVIQLVAILVCALTKICIGSPTPTIRTIVDFSWRNLCRLGIKLPMLKNLVATVMLEAEAGKGIEEEARA
ncbi:hypothetical protein PanWU01x14_299420 [Parasponia andersonii]|uniref:Uncharacterized protein n=1 Tax=Parasponia andersonii TaxID=3476 RepID=A0A2P5AUI4_PARAD|nr:hypothetical protein PanWU01x14_299420 [Parasponia andersonii]